MLSSKCRTQHFDSHFCYLIHDTRCEAVPPAAAVRSKPNKRSESNFAIYSFPLYYLSHVLDMQIAKL